MIVLIISIITVFISIVIACATVFRRYRSLSNISFSLGMLSTAAMIAADTFILYSPGTVDKLKQVVFASEAVMAGAWLLFAFSYARVNYWKTVNILSKILILCTPLLLLFVLIMPADRLFYSPEFETERILFLEDAGYIYNLFLLLYSIMAIISLETTLKSSTGTDRWRIKYVLIGIGGILSINIFYYSHALLYRSINMNLVPVKTGIILVSVLIAGLSALRRRVLDVEVTVSREIIYKSLSILVVGFYLLGLGIIGEGMRYLGPTVGRNITTFLGFVGAILVIIILMSEQVRKKTVVLINKHFFGQKYDYRDQWLRFTQSISLKHTFDELMQSIAEGFKEAIGVKSAAVWLKERERDEYVCVKALDTRGTVTGPGKEITDFLKDKKWVINTYDLNCAEIVERSRAFIKDSAASLIVPLLNVNDDLIGFVVLGEGLAGNEYNYEDYDLLKTLARQATAAILNAKLSRELTEAKEMEAMGRLSSFITHDLKNATSMLSLIAQNAEEHMDNPEFQRDAIKAISNTSEKMKGIMGKLKNLHGKNIMKFEYRDLGACVRSAIEGLNLNGNISLTFREEKPVKTTFDREEISKVIDNMVLNAIEATESGGKVTVAVGSEEERAYIRISDNGCGMSGEFMKSCLFKPFSTTKKKGLGIGLYQCKTIVENHSGELKVTSQEGKGTDFLIYLPLHNSELNIKQ